MNALVFRALLARGPQAWIATLAAALAAAAVVAIIMTGLQSSANFSLGAAGLGSEVNLQIVDDSGRGLDERLADRVAGFAGVRAALPVVSGTVVAISGSSQAFELVGIDVLRPLPLGADPRTSFVGAFSSGARTAAVPRLLQGNVAFLSREALSQLRLNVGSMFSVAGRNPQRLEVAGVFPADALVGPDVIFSDLASAQRALAKPGRLTRIDIVSDREAVPKVQSALRSYLPGGARLRAPRSAENALRAFDGAFGQTMSAVVQLTILFCALLAFNNTAALAAAAVPIVRSLRAIGVSRRHIFAANAEQAAMLAFIAAAAGVTAGALIASLASGARPPGPAFTPATSGFELVGIFAGSGIALLLFLVTPGTVLALRTIGFTRNAPRTPVPAWAVPLAITAAVLVLTSRAVSKQFAAAALTLDGLSIGLCVLAAGFAWPAFGRRLRSLRPAGPIVMRLGIANLSNAFAGKALLLLPLFLAAQLTVAASLLVGGFRQSLNDWLQSYYAGDVAVFSIDSRSEISRQEASAVAALAGVTSAGAMQTSSAELRGQTVSVRSQTCLSALRCKDAIVAGTARVDPALFENGLRRGDRIELRRGARALSLVVAGPFEDSRSESGTIFVSSGALHALGAPPRYDALALSLRPEASRAWLIERLRSRFPPGSFEIADMQRLRAAVLWRFEGGLTVATAIVYGGLLLALFGIAATVVSAVQERSREIALLRFLGLQRNEVAGAVAFEMGSTAVLVTFSGVLAGSLLASVALWFALSQGLPAVSIPARILPLAAQLGLIVVACVVFAVWPARVASRVSAGSAPRP